MKLVVAATTEIMVAPPRPLLTRQQERLKQHLLTCHTQHQISPPHLHTSRENGQESVSIPQQRRTKELSRHQTLNRMSRSVEERREASKNSRHFLRMFFILWFSWKNSLNLKFIEFEQRIDLKMRPAPVD